MNGRPVTSRAKRTLVSRKIIPASFDRAVSDRKKRPLRSLSRIFLAALIGTSLAKIIIVFFAFNNVHECDNCFGDAPHQKAADAKTATETAMNAQAFVSPSNKQMPRFLTKDYKERDGMRWLWGTESCGMRYAKVPPVKDLDIRTDVNVFGDRELPRLNFSKVRSSKRMSEEDIANVKVAVLPVVKDLNCCLEYKVCKTSLGGWDFTLQLYFIQRAVNISEADFLYVPFHQFCYTDKKSCTGKTVVDLLTMELTRAQELLRKHGREDLPMIVPMSHDFGACGKFNFNGYKQFNYFEPLRNTIVLSPNADFDEDCFDAATDVVVPAFAHYPTFGKKEPQSLRSVFGDVDSVKKSSDRQNLVFGGFSERFSQRKPGVRPWLMNVQNWRSGNVSVKKVPKFDSYVKQLNDTVFCLAPPGVVGWTGRLWDQIYAGCIPVIIAENTLFPFEDRFDYSKFALRFGFDDLGHIERRLLEITPQERDRLQAEGLRYREHFAWPRVDDLILPDRLRSPNAIDNLMNELAYAKHRLMLKRAQHRRL
mmetsp:Transcript_12213/g.37250  ORF Transcript_12213/g.37250 Transcript_12213/m.37250 type:complete len:536 (+) Transcript_12213:196-1803(+)|eukprot:CAMPEP_0198738108 /NCGR_PEP_ID=MMETSP1475-20131203/68203_1 /TAXON_ID= ORGANISM="Unidentified sp., Strain CCMP1999" /NCGR_SAMPLE_ID=MMETSP1475 /ASSEMBLY_ACC=CAM_ASM_001111 /LENGTH=535 /DNA_ID=CAMNT_0044501979 /DNA_START=1319 /DNA_END=2926 /DNA_ORIENTATION=-